MSRRIEDYALIGDLQTAALVGSDGSIDWLCLPRFDSPACFAGLLGEDRHGHWRIAPAAGGCRISRRYLPDTLILQTDFVTGAGAVRVTDCMPPRAGDPVVVRLVEGVSGTVSMRMTLAARFEYGSAQPSIRQRGGAQFITSGPESLWLFGPAHVRSREGTAIAEFEVSRGDRLPFAAVWRPSRASAPDPPLARELIRDAARYWTGWVSGLGYDGEWRDAVIRSLITVKALTHAPTGGLIAAPTTSLPERLSGARNWDYRYCWLRDAARAQEVMRRCGARAEAAELLDWISRAVAGPPAQVQNLYGVAGERLLPEIELDWLPGYEGARPVRIGNAAAAQAPLAAFGEVLTARLAARMAGLPDSQGPWRGDGVLSLLESGWREPDSGIWEVRGPPRQFVHSKLMVWAAADAAVKMIERFGDSGSAGRWRRLRSAVRADVLERGYDTGHGTFVLAYEMTGLDSSLLRAARLGLLPPGDERIRATVTAIARELDRGGVLARYVQQPGDGLDGLPPGEGLDGLPPGEGGYLPATFWLAQCLVLLGRASQAHELFGRLLELRSDVGLLGEQYDALRGRAIGNYPLAASHIELAATALTLQEPAGPASPGG